ncbi:hypothetical protein PYCCODRAFT_1442362 [Trametes coccinea BRFM310]|uniref:CxC1-like cysteine cluster associated with KDZ transposases domain-containing protein n=1 Tax=Trametes coccinea (strain BRFM310) TaxID=1353009 RepID=A0A1Y2J094_TRAC3|nr:hypothetical protein PYCCODRAFT_1442362 [Trametes coccinea BRFM310]
MEDGFQDDNDGDVWVDITDEGQDDDVVQMRDVLSLHPRIYRPKDERTWAHRMQNLDDNWRPLIPRLVSAYLRWQDAGDVSPSEPPLDSSAGPTSFDIDIIDFYTLRHSATVPMLAQCETRAEALVLSGYLGTSPLLPSLAISLKTLELFRRLRLFKASFSVEAFTKLLCYYYKMPYRRTYRASLSNAFDIFLLITREVEKGVSRCLGRDIPDWRVLHACPPCGYTRLAPLGGRQAGDRRVMEDSDYFLPTSFVDTFAKEVRSRPSAALADDDDEDIDIRAYDPTAEGNAGEEGDPTDGTAVVSSCTKNWKAAAAEEKKRSWGIFDETGIFASACRHGLILWLVDMVRCGESAKHGLATVAKVLRVLQDPTLGGFDIGCSFLETVLASSLRAAFLSSGSRLCVNAFHGYSHNYQCQLRNHPNIIPGIGLEDLEGMERIFSASNHLAPIIRYASAYRRRLLIDAFFHHWDEEKYQNLALMLYNNLKQALDIINKTTPELSDALKSISATVEDLREYRRRELEYFDQLGEEQPRDIHAIAYVETLHELYTISAELDDAEERFLKTVPADYAPSLAFLPPINAPVVYEAETSATRKAETRRRFLRERQKVLTLEVTALEVKLGIKARWQPGDAEYVRVLDYIAERKYHRALGRLQRLVVQRLFELQRMNLARTAYRIRTHIAKHLQSRCKAIRNAVKTYNAAAAALKPPRPALDWERVSHMSFIEEFELLKDTRGDLKGKPWSQPVVRETMRLAHRIDRAQEEIERVCVEVRRLHTSIRDEDVLFAVVLDDLTLRGDPWHGVVLDHITRRQRVNARLLVYIDKIYATEGFVGVQGPGQRAGADNLHAAVDEERLALSGEEDVSEPEDEQEEVATAYADYVASIV